MDFSRYPGWLALVALLIVALPLAISGVMMFAAVPSFLRRWLDSLHIPKRGWPVWGLVQTGLAVAFVFTEPPGVRVLIAAAVALYYSALLGRSIQTRFTGTRFLGGAAVLSVLAWMSALIHFLYWWQEEAGGLCGC